MSEKKLFCIHVLGPDDLIPVRSEGEAVRASAYMNAEYLEMRERLNSELTPYCYAVPSVWPHSEDAHEEALRRLIDKGRKTGHAHWLCA